MVGGQVVDVESEKNSAKEYVEMLSDDDIIMLDNSMNLISTDSEANFDDIDALDDAVDEILGDQKDYTVKKQKLKKKNNQNNKDNNDYLKKKKAMYKNKTKLSVHGHTVK